MLFTGFPLRCSYRPLVFVLVFRVEVPRWGALGKGVHPLLRSLRLLSYCFSGPTGFEWGYTSTIY